jgi:LPS-assembly lipoprotein
MKQLLTRRLFGMSTLASGLSLAGCGFQPVYMPTASGKAGPAQRELAAVYVKIIPDRPGQLLRQALQERFRDDSGTPATYDLAVNFSIVGEGIGIETNNIATRLRLTGNASYTLIDRSPKAARLTSGSARAIDAVNIFDSQYFAADLETEAKQKSIADACAEQITNQLATWFRARANRAAIDG